MIADRNDGALLEAALAARPCFDAAPPRDRQRYRHAIGKLLHDRGRHDEAFAAFAEAGRIGAEMVGYDADTDRANAVAALEGAASDAIAKIGASMTLRSQRPIFVTGLPRSGTTLVEQVLASHSAVCGGDELGFFHPLIEQIGGASVAALDRWISAGNEPSRLTERYLDLIAQRFGPEGRVVDKTLEASRYLGLVATLFPDAPIVWVRRDPLDCAFSNFRTDFGTRLPWSNDLEAMATHFRLEQALYECWTRILGPRLHTIVYEDLATHPDREIPRLLEHCGLAMETAALRPEHTDRAVTTMSAVQVRRPISTEGIGSAQPYATALTPFIEALERPASDLPA
jgi:hypothetical protein